jgi:hypothetical protein
MFWFFPRFKNRDDLSNFPGAREVPRDLKKKIIRAGADQKFQLAIR